MKYAPVPSRWKKILVHSGLLLVCATTLFAANEVSAIRGNVEIVRMGTKGNMLHVSDMVEVINDSLPSLTQTGDRTFEVYLPAQARIDSVLAAGPDKVGMRISAIPIAGEPGHFTVNFPLRPGATKFAFNYDLPYPGHATFHPRIRYPLQKLVVMFPPTMKFNSQSSVFQPLPTGGGKYVVEAVRGVKAGYGLDFEISGMGELPALQAGTPPKPPPIVASRVPAGHPQPTPQPAQRPKHPSDHSQPSWWWLLSLVAVFALGISTVVTLRKRKAARALEDAEQTRSSRVDVLKEELSRLEIDRSRGTISPAEFESARQALEGTVKGALTRASDARI